MAVNACEAVLLDLLAQVRKFCEEQGEADFETGAAEAMKRRIVGMQVDAGLQRQLDKVLAAYGVGGPEHGCDQQKTAPEAWRPMKAAPRDGTIVRLLVDYRGDDACHPLEDEPITHTIGGCTDGNTGLREGWKFAGWSWEQDCFCEGRGKPIGWLPFDAPAPGVTRLDESKENDRG